MSERLTHLHLSRRGFLRRAMLGLGSLIALPALLPTVRAASAIGWETRQQVLDIAATVEALAITFYYQAVQSGFFIRLPTDAQNYLRANLDQERSHRDTLAAQGAQPPSGPFYFPAAAFGFDGLPLFLSTLDTLETALIALHLAAARRFGEIGEPVMAEVAGQMVGIEAEHRIIGRELAGNSPPPPNNLCFERAALLSPSHALAALRPFLNADGGHSLYLLPTPEQIDGAVRDAHCTPVLLAEAATCMESVAGVLNVAAVAEALGITFYYHGIRGGIFPQLSEPRQWYLQAALDEERTHLDFLRASGAAAPPAQFFFPASAFDDLPTFLGVLDGLENAFIGAYLAAMQRFARLGQPLLAEIAGQILGIEAEHRVLGRFIARADLPHDLCLERAIYGCLSDAVTALAPFLEGDTAHTQPATMPAPEEIADAVDRFGCAPVPVAQPLRLLFHPRVSQ